jgi:hypothetical protein
MSVFDEWRCPNPKCTSDNALHERIDGALMCRSCDTVVWPLRADAPNDSPDDAF